MRESYLLNPFDSEWIGNIDFSNIEEDVSYEASADVTTAYVPSWIDEYNEWCK